MCIETQHMKLILRSLVLHIAITSRLVFYTVGKYVCTCVYLCMFVYVSVSLSLCLNVPVFIDTEAACYSIKTVSRNKIRVLV